MNYYNEFDPAAATWLRNLIADGLIPAGHIDTRSILDVRPADLAGYTQCHFFAGIGGWSLAARLAGWPDSRELWTGSAPCQPFSVAGKGKAQADDRHLWPHFFRLIRECRPCVVMGEQVAAAINKGWLDGVFSDLEGEGYACEAAIVPACAVNAPHRRDRVWFVADASSERCAGRENSTEGNHANRDSPGREENSNRLELCGEGALADSDIAGLEGWSAVQERGAERAAGQDGVAGAMADPNSAGSFARNGNDPTARHWNSVAAACGAGAWDRAGWIVGHDGKARRVEPSIRLLAHGVSGRMAIQRTVEQGGTEVEETHWYSRIAALRGFGNAIVPQVAAEVIGAYMDVACT